MELDPELADLLGARSPESAPPSRSNAAARPVAPPASENSSALIFSKAQLADFLDLTAKRVEQLQADGVLKPIGGSQRPRFHARDAVRAYCIFIREKASRGVAVNDALKDQRVRKESAMADKAELQNAALRGELVNSADVARAWGDIARDVRSGMLAVPSRAGSALQLDAAGVAVIEREIHSALERLADDALPSDEGAPDVD